MKIRSAPLLTALTLLVASLMATAPAFGQATGARGDYFTYRFRPGDILLTLSQRFTHNEDNWKAIREINGIADQYKIPVGFELKVPFSMIDEIPAVATISHLRGKAFVNGLPIRETGGQIQEGSVVAAGPDSNVTLTLPDKSKVLVPADSSVTAKRLRQFSGTGYIDAIFTIEKGDVQSHVDPGVQGVGRFEIRTPVSVTGVRGTIVRAGMLQNQGVYSAIVKGHADVSQPGATAITSLAANQGLVSDSQGRAQAARSLLPPPVLRPLPGQRQNQISQVQFDPVPGAVAYQVILADDTEGYDVLWSRRITETQVRLPAVRNGTVYALIRSVDDQGLAGADSVLPLQQIMNTINDGQGSPVATGSGEYLLRTSD